MASNAPRFPFTDVFDYDNTKQWIRQVMFNLYDGTMYCVTPPYVSSYGQPNFRPLTLAEAITETEKQLDYFFVFPPWPVLDCVKINESNIIELVYIWNTDSPKCLRSGKRY